MNCRILKLSECFYDLLLSDIPKTVCQINRCFFIALISLFKYAFMYCREVNYTLKDLSTFPTGNVHIRNKDVFL